MAAGEKENFAYTLLNYGREKLWRRKTLAASMNPEQYQGETPRTNNLRAPLVDPGIKFSYEIFAAQVRDELPA